MKKIINLVVIVMIFSFVANAQSYEYHINLNNLKKDKLTVKLKCSAGTDNKLIYYFPKTVPGTYSELDYGRYISKFSAFDKHGNKLKVKRIDINSYLINDANLLANIQYEVDDTWDEKVKKKYRIMEPGGTGFEKDKYFVLNNGGIFGCFEGKETQEIHINITSNSILKAYTSLKKKQSGNKTQFTAKNYHQLIDCPILFTSNKPEYLKVGKCNITLAIYSVNDSASIKMKREVEKIFTAIETFVESIPVEKYNILVFVDDFTKLGEGLKDDKLGIIDIFRLLKLMKKGIGALEHGTSSLYYLPDLGDQTMIPFDYAEILSEELSHEFMHIYTPLNLHSDLVGNFNYRNPKMSKHLWLYEGVTEYFSVLLRMQGSIMNVGKTLRDNFKGKIRLTKYFPDTISFTEMSQNIFKKPYKRLYFHVYDKGAIIAMLLDFEIMKLTDGKKTLKSVIFELSEKYGQNRNFDEDMIISEFVNLVHPDLKQFFDNYVTGTKPLNLENGFNTVGITFKDTLVTKIPINILSEKDNGVKAKKITITTKRKIKKIYENEIVGFKKGDRIEKYDAIDCFLDKDYNYVKEGTIITVPVIRNDKKIELSFPAKYKKGTLKNAFIIEENKTEQQKRLFKLWTTGK